jgi:DNA-binding MarR family transcriptional regulator
MMATGPPLPPGLHAALVRNTGYLLSRLGFWAQRQFSARIEELGLTPRMWGALNVLEAEGAVSQQELGRSIGMDPSTMVATIDELESSGLVERRRHPRDRRAYALHITDEGLSTLARGRRVAARAQNQLLAPLNEEERKMLHGLLLRLAEAADESSGQAETGGAAGPETEATAGAETEATAGAETEATAGAETKAAAAPEAVRPAPPTSTG